MDAVGSRVLEGLLDAGGGGRGGLCGVNDGVLHCVVSLF